jgi:hypothetical protein
VTLTYLGGAALAIWVLYALISNKATENKQFAFAVAAIFVGLSVPLSFHDINLHMMHYVDPLQNHVMRLLWMVPIYSLQSWAALVYKEDAFFLQTGRECYEAYCLYSFFMLMLGSLGGKEVLSSRLLSTGKERAKCLPPCCCLRGWRMGSRFVHRCQVGVYQYVLIRVVVSIISLISHENHTYHEGEWDARYFYPYSSFIINCSQMVALYMLAYLYMNSKEWMKPLSPLVKL